MQNSTNDNTAAAALDFGLVLVVGSSPVNRVVVSRIGERAGLRVVSTTPDQVGTALSDPLPILVVLDGGADNDECDLFIDELDRLRRPVADRRAPLVILLSNHRTPDPDRESAVDAVIAKPIMPDTLQPVMQDMIRDLQRLQSG